MTWGKSPNRCSSLFCEVAITIPISRGCPKGEGRIHRTREHEPEPTLGAQRDVSIITNKKGGIRVLVSYPFLSDQVAPNCSSGWSRVTAKPKIFCNVSASPARTPDIPLLGPGAHAPSRPPISALQCRTGGAGSPGPDAPLDARGPAVRPAGASPAPSAPAPPPQRTPEPRHPRAVPLSESRAHGDCKVWGVF